MAGSLRDFICEVDIEIMDGLLDQCVHNLEKKLSQQNNSQEYLIHEQKCRAIQKNQQAPQQTDIQGSQNNIHIHRGILKPPSEQLILDSEVQQHQRKVHFSNLKVYEKQQHLYQNQQKSIQQTRHIGTRVNRQLINDASSVPIDLKEIYSSSSPPNQFSRFKAHHSKEIHRKNIDQQEYKEYLMSKKKQEQQLQQERGRINSFDHIYNQQDKYYHYKIS